MGSKTININKVVYTTFGALFIATILSILALINMRVSADDNPTASVSSSSATATNSATTTNSATASVNVSAACTLSGGDNNYTGTITPGTYVEYGPSTIKAVCNDSNGFSLYAIGYSGDSYTANNHNKLIASTGSDDDIPTINSSNDNNDGSSATTNSSYWAMRLNPVASTHTPTITNNYDDYSSIPATYTKVASYPSSTMNPSDPTTKDTGSTVQATYKVNISPSQPAGTYTGAVRYTLVHPHNAIPQDKYYMQDFTISMCEVLAHDDNFTVYDKRDNNDYTVRYLDGQCIMTQNLRYVGGNHGVAEEGVAVNSAGVTFAMESNTAQNWTEPYYYNSGRDDYGVYYNYCAASGTTVCALPYQDTLEDASATICPANWGLPESLSYFSWGGISTQSILDSGNFNVLAGYYGDDGALNGLSERGLWWSNNNADDQSIIRRNLRIRVSGDITANDATMRGRLLSVRCIANQ